MYVTFLLAADLFDLTSHLRVVGLGGDCRVVVGCVLLAIEKGVELFS